MAIRAMFMILLVPARSLATTDKKQLRKNFGLEFPQGIQIEKRTRPIKETARKLGEF
jgi:hypothetical protein